MVSFFPAANAVAVAELVPIFNVPVETTFTTKPVTVPSLSASLPAAVKSANVIVFSVSSVPPVIFKRLVIVGIAFGLAIVSESELVLEIGPVKGFPGVDPLLTVEMKLPFGEPLGSLRSAWT